MSKYNTFIRDLPKVNESNFEKFALSLFQYQAMGNRVYKDYLKLLGIIPTSVKSLSQIPFLPIEFFKNHTIATESWEPEECFLSSGTTGQIRSKHFVRDSNFYRNHSRQIFESVYGPLSNVCLLALLPSYQEQGSSSLIVMVNHLMKLTGDFYSGYFKENSTLLSTIHELRDSEKRVIVIGVTFALLDLAEENPKLYRTTIIETGGMKGRRKEITREELHRTLKKQFGLQHVHSEYGMTELMSQSYALENGLFKPSRWMKILIRDINDPFSKVAVGKSGGINVIDLGNIHSCAFVETKDIGRTRKDGLFEVLGRVDNSDVRGCNLLIN